MPFDAIFMTALAGELRQALTGGKVDKLYQPARDEAVLHMRAGKENVRLLLSAALPEGCKFHPRCKHCQEVCRLQPPPVQREGEHIYRCHFKLF